ncbi:MAG: WD40 repeat domain-containing protein [Candidatus Promineifilaceae bacterium]
MNRTRSFVLLALLCTTVFLKSCENNAVHSVGFVVPYFDIVEAHGFFRLLFPYNVVISVIVNAVFIVACTVLILKIDFSRRRALLSRLSVALLINIVLFHLSFLILMVPLSAKNDWLYYLPMLYQMPSLYIASVLENIVRLPDLNAASRVYLLAVSAVTFLVLTLLSSLISKLKSKAAGKPSQQKATSSWPKPGRPAVTTGLFRKGGKIDKKLPPFLGGWWTLPKVLGALSLVVLTLVLVDIYWTRQSHTVLKGSGIVYEVDFSPDGRLVAGTNSNGLQLWDTATGEDMGILRGAEAFSVEFSPDGRTIAGGFTSYRSDHKVMLWDLNTHRLVATLKGHRSVATALAFSPDGRTLATGGGKFDGTIRLWDLATFEEMTVLEADYMGVEDIVFTPDSQVLVALSGFGSELLMWDLAGSQALPIPSPIEYWHSVSSMAYEPEGHTFAGAGGDFLAIWDLETLQQVKVFKTDEDWLFTSVEYSPSGQTLATGDTDGMVRIWDIATGKEEASLGGFLTGHRYSVMDIAFSPDGRMLATGGMDDTVRLWPVPGATR